MRRRVAIVFAACAGILVAGEVAAVSAYLLGQRRTAERRYRDETAEAARRIGEAERAGAPRGEARLCLRGVDTAVAALAAADRALPIDRRGRLDAAALARLSARATSVEDRIERAGGLGQQLGRQRTAGGWRSLAPAAVTCGGKRAVAVLRAPAAHGRAPGGRAGGAK